MAENRIATVKVSSVEHKKKNCLTLQVAEEQTCSPHKVGCLLFKECRRSNLQEMNEAQKQGFPPHLHALVGCI